MDIEVRMSEIRVHELIRAFDDFDESYKRAELDEAITLREEITPHLIGILEELAADPVRYAVEDHYANVYAAALLAYFQEPAAHLPIIRAFCIPDDEREELWGDMVSETLPALLLQTCNGSLDTIRELVRNREIHDYVRGAAVVALTYAVARDVAERHEVVEFLSGFFTGTEAGDDSDFWSEVASSITDLHPEGAMEVLRKAYAEELISPWYVGLEEIEEAMGRDQEAVLAELRAFTDRNIPADLHEYLSWFACFREKSLDRPRVSPAKIARKARETQKKTNRAKAKTAKKARKKNRVGKKR